MTMNSLLFFSYGSRSPLAAIKHNPDIAPPTCSNNKHTLRAHPLLVLTLSIACLTCGLTPHSKGDELNGVAISLYGWNGAALPFKFHNDRLTLWQCRATCGKVNRVSIKATALAAGKDRVLASLDAPLESGASGTLFVVHASEGQQGAASDDYLASIGLSFENISRDTAAARDDLWKNRTLVHFITPREDFTCVAGDSKVICLLMFGDPDEAEDERDLVAEAAAAGDVKKLVRSASACMHTYVVIVELQVE